MEVLYHGIKTRYAYDFPLCFAHELIMIREVHITSMGILDVCNLWILLRKIVIYLGRLLLKLTEMTSTQESVKRFSYAQIPVLTSF